MHSDLVQVGACGICLAMPRWCQWKLQAQGGRSAVTWQKQTEANSLERLDFQLGGVDENGWYSKNGALARRSQDCSFCLMSAGIGPVMNLLQIFEESDCERQLFSKASFTKLHRNA